MGVSEKKKKDMYRCFFFWHYYLTVFKLIKKTLICELVHTHTPSSVNIHLLCEGSIPACANWDPNDRSNAFDMLMSHVINHRVGSCDLTRKEETLTLLGRSQGYYLSVGELTSDLIYKWCTASINCKKFSNTMHYTVYPFPSYKICSYYHLQCLAQLLAPLKRILKKSTFHAFRQRKPNPSLWYFF